MASEIFDLTPEARSIVEKWGQTISKGQTGKIDLIISNGEDVVRAIEDIQPFGLEARKALLTIARMSQSQFSKWEAVGKHADLFREHKENLPASFSSLYFLTTLPREVLDAALAIDLRSKSRTDLEAQFKATSTKGTGE